MLFIEINENGLSKYGFSTYRPVKKQMIVMIVAARITKFSRFIVCSFGVVVVWEMKRGNAAIWRANGTECLRRTNSVVANCTECGGVKASL